MDVTSESGTSRRKYRRNSQDGDARHFNMGATPDPPTDCKHTSHPKMLKQVWGIDSTNHLGSLKMFPIILLCILRSKTPFKTFKLHCYPLRGSKVGCF